jgi:hypothetical protein
MLNLNDKLDNDEDFSGIDDSEIGNTLNKTIDLFRES